MDSSQSSTGKGGKSMASQVNYTADPSSMYDLYLNLKQVINSIQKTLGLIHQVYLTVSSFTTASQMPLLQRLNELVLELDNMVKVAEKCNIQVPLEVLNLIDDGKNPDQFTRDFLNSCIAKNQVAKGKTDVFKGLRNNVLVELDKAFPDEVESYRQMRKIAAGLRNNLLVELDKAFPDEVESCRQMRTIAAAAAASADVAELERGSHFVDGSVAEYPASSFAGEINVQSASSFAVKSSTNNSRGIACNSNTTWTSSSSPESQSPAVGKPRIKIKIKRVSSPTVDGVIRRCTHCAAEKTPQWRNGPLGPKTLCNACGVRYNSGRLVPEYRPAASPTFVPTQHSNSHRKVSELRRQKEIMRQQQVQEQQQEEAHHVPPSSPTGF